MNLKKLFAAVLAVCMLVFCLSACAPAAPEAPAEPVVAEPTAAPAVQPTEAPAEEEKPEEEKAAFTPGTYRVEAMGHNAVITAEVTFSEDAITDIVVVEHSESKSVGDVAMEAMTAEVLERQSLNVDTLAGATVTGAIFRNMLTEAVKLAGGDPSAMQQAKEVAVPTAEELSAEVDVVIVGGGAAGLAAAVTAHEEGLSAILVEQLGILGGSSGRAGGVTGADTSILKANGMTWTAEQYYDYIAAPATASIHEDLIDREYCKEFSVRAGENIEWLYDLGTEFVVTFGVGMHYGANTSRVAWSMIKSMKDYLDENGGEYRLNTKATELLMDGDKVVGIKAEYEGVEYEIKADAVIMATGGYLANKEIVAKYKPGYENNGYDVSIGNDGSGLEMALEAGAVAKHMDICGFHALATWYNGVSRSLSSAANAGCIAVNAAGQRYTNEAGLYSDFTEATMKQDQVFCIMDSVVFSDGRVASDTGLSNIVEMYTVCDTLDELAVELGIDPAGLAATAERYGEFVRNGVDEDYGKAASSLTGDFTKGPFYGVKANVENHTVYGGIEVDNGGHVLREDGSVIDGLYAAGELIMFKTGGRCPLPETVDMGRICAKTIAAAK